MSDATPDHLLRVPPHRGRRLLVQRRPARPLAPGVHVEGSSPSTLLAHQRAEVVLRAVLASRQAGRQADSVRQCERGRQDKAEYRCSRGA